MKMLSNAQKKLSGKRNQKSGKSRKLSTRQMLALTAAVAPFSGLLGQSAHAVVYTWTGGNSTGLWPDFANWSPNSGSPSTTSDTATFNGLGNSTLVISTGNATVGSVIFNLGAGSYTIGAGAAGNETLTFNASGSINLDSTVTGNETFDSTIVLGSNAVGGNATFTNNSGFLLDFAGNITGGSGSPSGTENLFVNGSGNTLISGSLVNGGNSTSPETIALTKTGSGTLTFNGVTNAALLPGGANAGGGAFGTVTINSGKLVLDFSNFNAVGNANLLNSYSTVSLGGGTLQMIGNAGNASTQGFNGANSLTNTDVTSNPGLNVISVGPNGGNTSLPLPTLNLGGFVQTIGSQTEFIGPATINGSGNVSATGTITTTFVGDGANNQTPNGVTTTNKGLFWNNTTRAGIATVGLYDWASTDTAAGGNGTTGNYTILGGSQVTGFYTTEAAGNLPASDQNLDITGNVAGRTSSTTAYNDTWRFNTAASITVAGVNNDSTNNIMELGGILVTPNVAAHNITINGRSDGNWRQRLHGRRRRQRRDRRVPEQHVRLPGFEYRALPVEHHDELRSGRRWDCGDGPPHGRHGLDWRGGSLSQWRQPGHSIGV
jgi:hypothetical protein